MPVHRLLHESLLDEVNGAAADKAAIVIAGREYSYGLLRRQVRRLGGALRERGVERGDRVVIYMDNTWECVVCVYATLFAGGVFVLVNPQTKADKLAFILDDCGARVLLTDSHLAHELVPGIRHAKTSPAVIVSGTPPTDQGESFEAVLAASADDASSAPAIALDLAALIYTSGSTGSPKGVMQTHQAMLFAVGSLTEYLRLSAEDRILLCLPMAFDYGLYQMLMTLQLGATLVIERSFTYAAQVLTCMREQSVTVFPGVPTIYAMLLSMHRREPLRFEHVTRVTNTAAHLPDQFLGELREIFPNALIYKMYGLTECKRVCYLDPARIDDKPGSVGKAIPGTEVYLLSESGEPTPRGETGILYVRGPHVMLGYWNRPEQTSHMLKAGRWPGERVLCTHDHFRTDEEGFLYFVGRTDDIIKTRGEKVSPIEVENVLHRVPGVREAAVIGIADDLLGQAIRAYVVRDPGSLVEDRAIRAYCMAHLENFMVPKEIVFCAELPKTDTGKVSKQLLRQRHD